MKSRPLNYCGKPNLSGSQRNPESSSFKLLEQIVQGLVSATERDRQVSFSRHVAIRSHIATKK